VRHLSERVLERMPAGASIVNVASILGAEWPQRLEQHKALAQVRGFAAGEAWLRAQPVPQQTCYQYFKEALIVWTAVQAQPWFLERSVRMNCVAPGPVFTPILGDFVTMLGEARVQKDAGRIKRPGFADEIAPAIAFLCADESRWINGVNLPVDGGLGSTYV
jgi:NAD(P)-dependent dehydrogenase (short-subunit alcohol dehydrogenase family)